MKYNYCTVFDKGFLNRGLALYNSIIKYHKNDFRFFVLCLDKETYEIIKKLDLKYVIPIKLSDFENKEILGSKKTRSFREYCWSLSSIFTNYILEKIDNIEIISYLDADLFFFESPEKIIDPFAENTNYSILISPHNLPDSKKSKEEAVGKYNVGMLCFKNNKSGKDCLKWWSNSCLEWCYDIVEPTRYGDQKYLDYFEKKFNGVFITKSNGICLAPWNIKRFKGNIKKKDDEIKINKDSLIYFHFSSFKIFSQKSIFLPNSPLGGTYNYLQPSIEKKLIYKKYFDALYDATKQIKEIDPNFNYGTIERPKISKQIVDIIVPLFIENTKKILIKILPKPTVRFIQKIKNIK